jgi:glycosyltransferase involved in cell wall biosynthesis
MRPGDLLHHPWKYLRRDVPHIWYADNRFPLMGFMNRDEATLLYNIALQFRGKGALEIGSWLGWSTCHVAMAGVTVDVIDPAHTDPGFRAIVEESLARCGVSAQVRLSGGRSPENVATLAAATGRKWSLFVIDGDHDGPAPARDTAACLPYAADDCAFVLHDLASPDVADALRFLQGEGFHVLLYQTAQIMGLAWRGGVVPIAHVPDPEVAWQLPHHLIGLPVSGVDFSSRPPPQSDCVAQPVHSTGALARMEAAFPECEPAMTTPPPSVCIVTNEIIGPFRNGGIGTAMTGLAEVLAKAGQRVTVLYTGDIWEPVSAMPRWRRHYAAKGIELAVLSLDDMRAVAGPLRDCGFGAPWLVYQYLRANHFDVVHFNDCCGEGYLALAAKRLGLAFQETLLVVALHSPSQWVLELNHTLPASLLLAAYSYAEHLSVRCADVVWSPSRYMMEWVRQHDFILPKAAYLQQYVLPGPPPEAVTYGPAPTPRTIVFFGRLEERKGLRLFCNAIDNLRVVLTEREIAIVFLGKPATVAGKNSLDYIASRAKQWRFSVKMITTLGQPEALAFLRSRETLAVMPSPLDNSPCTVYEALAYGFPFLAARTGGIGELIDDGDRDKVLFDYTTPSLCAALLRAINDGGWIARPSMPQGKTRERWVAFHTNWRTFLPSPEPASAVPDVVAIIDHHAGMNLEGTLRSIEECEGIRRVVVLNRSGKRLPSGRSSVLPLREINLSLEDAETLDEELANIQGDAALLIHSGVVVLPAPFGVMRNALGYQKIEGLTPGARVIAGAGAQSKILNPLGGSASFSLFHGLTFTGGLLIRGDALLNARWRRPFAVESAFLGLADFCAARSSEIWPWPDPVFDCPQDFQTRDQAALPARVAAYADTSFTDRYYMLSAGYGAATGVSSTGSKRRMALAIADLGLGSLLRSALWARRRARALRSRLRGGRS